MTLLSLVVLSIIACTSFIFALSTHGEAERGTNTLYSASNGASNVRNLKQNVTSVQPTEIEDRALEFLKLAPVASRIRNYRPEVDYRARLSHWEHPSKTPQNAFEFLKLHEGDENIFNRPAFSAWYEFVHKNYPKNAGDAIIETMLRHRSLKDLVTPLLVALQTRGQREMGRKIYSYLHPYFTSHDITEEWVYSELGLDGLTFGTVLSNELVPFWIDYVRSSERKWWYYICMHKLHFVSSYRAVKVLTKYEHQFVPLVKPELGQQ